MEAAVEAFDSGEGILGAFADIEEAHILRGDEVGIQEFLTDKTNPAAPESLTRRIQQNNGWTYRSA